MKTPKNFLPTKHPKEIEKILEEEKQALTLDNLLKKNENIEGYAYDPALVECPELAKVEFETYFSVLNWQDIAGNMNAVYTKEGNMVEVFAVQLKKDIEEYLETLREELYSFTGYHACTCLTKEDFAVFIRTPEQNSPDLFLFENYYREKFGMKRIRRKEDNLVDLGAE